MGIRYLERPVAVSEFNVASDAPKRKKIRYIDGGKRPSRGAEGSWPAPKRSIYPEIDPQEQLKSPYLSAAAKTGRDITAIPASFFNQYLLNYPRSVTEKLGYEYPSETDNPVAGALAKGAGVAGALTSPIWKMLPTLSGAGRGASLPKVVRGALEGAAGGALYSPQDVTDLGARGTQAATGAALGGGFVVGARAAKEVGPLLAKGARRIGGVSSKAIKWLKQRGSKNIFTPAKEAVDYVKTHLAPQVQEIYEKSVDDFIEPVRKYAVDKLKVPVNAVNTITKMGYGRVKEVAAKFGNRVDDFVDVIDNGLDAKVEQAGNMFDESLAGLEKPYVNAGRTKNAASKILRENNFLKPNGDIVDGFGAKEVPQVFKVIADVYERVRETNTLDVNDFRFFRRMIRKANKTSGEFYIDGSKVIDSLYDDVAHSGAVGIKDAKRAYAVAKGNQKAYQGKFKVNKLNKYHKMTKQELADINNIQKHIDDNFIDDLAAVTAEKEMSVYQKRDIDWMSDKLQSATDPKNTESVRRQLSEIIGPEQADDIINNIKDHMVSQEFSGKAARGLYPSVPGTTRGFVREGLRQYYEKINPVVKRTQQGAGELKRRLNQPL